MIDSEIQNVPLVERLGQHAMVGKSPQEEWEWLASHGELRRYSPGDPVIRKGDPTDELMILLAGTISTYMDRGSGMRKAIEWHAGEITGALPYSRMSRMPGEAFADEPTEFLVINRRDFSEMISACPILTATCVQVMVDRARTFKAYDMQDEKVMSLGRLSAGLAHELNNPASAASRSAHLITEAIAEVETVSRELGALRLNDAQLAAIEAVRDACSADAGSVALTTLERGDREDEISAWMEARGISPSYATPLADTCVTIGDLDPLAAVLDASVVATAIRWVAAGCGARALSSEVEKATSRIYDLISAVKRFTYMDRPVAPEPVPLGQGLDDAVMLLTAKANSRSISVELDIEPDIPLVQVIGGDINQVWTNLLDNALDAAPSGGAVSVTARRDGDWVLVRVTDDGPGIPPELGERVFDAFVTTKPVGQGTGLGLDIARRIVRQGGGDVTFQSQPGKTEFLVRLPGVTTA